MRSARLHSSRPWAVLLLAVCLGLPWPASAADWISGEVVGISDGDTVTVLTQDRQQYKLRLAWIDAPESGMPFGHAARQALAARIFRQQVDFSPIDRDRYGRHVALIRQGLQDINRWQLEEGWAWHYVHYARSGQPAAQFEDYATAEAAARTAGRGLWQDRQPLPPWSWRAQRRPDRR